MPVDRIITVRTTTEGMRNEHGEFEPGVATDHTVWASRFDASLTDVAESGGSRGETLRDWRIRYRADFAAIAELSRVTVIDDGLTFNVQNLIEETGRDGITRRRWLRISGVKIVKIWPFNQKLETRADSSYTDALVAAITANAGGQSTAFPSATGALEACAGMVSRAFMTAEVKSDPIVVEALTPDVLGMIGRALIRKGQIVQYIDTSSGSLRLLPCESHDVAGYPIRRRGAINAR